MRVSPAMVQSCRGSGPAVNRKPRSAASNGCVPDGYGAECAMASNRDNPDFRLAPRRFSLPPIGARVAALTREVFSKRRSEEHTSELQSRENLVCRLLLE